MYTLTCFLSFPFIIGAHTDGIHHFLNEWGEPLLAAFMIICGILLFFSGHHHHDHDHGMSKWLQTVDDKSSWLWAFMLGIFFAIAFCPHRLMYFFTMIEMSVSLESAWTWFMPVIFGLGTGLPIIIIAWIICYSAITTEVLTAKVKRFEKWFRYICAVLFLGFGIYLALENLLEHC